MFMTGAALKLLNEQGPQSAEVVYLDIGTGPCEHVCRCTSIRARYKCGNCTMDEWRCWQCVQVHGWAEHTMQKEPFDTILTDTLDTAEACERDQALLFAIIGLLEMGCDPERLASAMFSLRWYAQDGHLITHIKANKALKQAVDKYPVAPPERQLVAGKAGGVRRFKFEKYWRCMDPLALLAS